MGTASLDDLSAQQQVIERARVAFQRDERVVAAWLGGSFGAGTADRWSDIDLRVAVPHDAYDDFVADQGVLESLGAVLGVIRLKFGEDEFRAAVLDGPVRLDLLVTTPERALSARSEVIVPLVDPNGIAARVAEVPAFPPRTPRAAFEFQTVRARNALSGLEQAIRRGAIVAALSAQSEALDSGMGLALFLTDEQAAISPSPKAASGVLGPDSVRALLAPLNAWSDRWPDATRDSIDATVAVLEPLVKRCNEQFGADESLSGGALPAPADLQQPGDAVDRAFDVLVHATVEAAAMNRGLHTLALWGRGHVARLVASLEFVVATAGQEPVPPDPELHLPDGGLDDLARSIRRLRPGTADALRASGAAEWSLFGRVGRQAAEVMGVDYPARLERSVLGYLAREGTIHENVADR